MPSFKNFSPTKKFVCLFCFVFFFSNYFRWKRGTVRAQNTLKKNNVDFGYIIVYILLLATFTEDTFCLTFVLFVCLKLNPLILCPFLVGQLLAPMLSMVMNGVSQRIVSRGTTVLTVIHAPSSSFTQRSINQLSVTTCSRQVIVLADHSVLLHMLTVSILSSELWLNVAGRDVCVNVFYLCVK